MLSVVTRMFIYCIGFQSFVGRWCPSSQIDKLLFMKFWLARYIALFTFKCCGSYGVDPFCVHKFHFREQNAGK